MPKKKHDEVVRAAKTTPVFDAIDLAFGCAVYLFAVAALGAFAFFMGRQFLTGLPIIWDGSSRMWTALWYGVHAVGLPVLTIWFVIGLPFYLKERREKTVRRRASDNVWLVFMLIGLTGLNGFFPDDGVTWKMPLWLGVLLTCVGAFGMYQAFILARDDKSE